MLHRYSDNTGGLLSSVDKAFALCRDKEAE